MNEITIAHPWIGKLRALVDMLRGAGNVGREITLGDVHGWSHPFDMADFQQAYRVHPWVFTCVRIIASTAASVPLAVYREVSRGDDLEKEPIPGDELAQLLRRPNPNLSGVQLIENTVAYRKLNGNAYWFLARASGSRVDMIIPLRPDRVTVKLDSRGVVEGYLYQVGGDSYRLEYEDVIHHKEFNPYHDHYGMSPLEAIRTTLNDDSNARKYNLNFFKNSAIPRGALTSDKPISDADVKRIAEDWKNAHQGTKYAHKIAILEKGLKWMNIGMSNQDMEFLAKLKMNRDEIASVFGVPPSKVNDFEHGNYANATVQERDFVHDTILPTLRNVADTITLNTWKIRGLTAAVVEPTHVEFDFSNVPALRKERNELAKADREDVKVGLRTINEIRTRDNLEPVDWGDAYWKPMGLVPANAGAETVTSSVANAVDGNAKQQRMVDVATETHKRLPLVISDHTLLENKAPKDERPPRERFFGEWKAFIVHADHWEPVVQRFAIALFADQHRIMRDNFAKWLASKDATYDNKAASEVEVEAILFDLEKAIDATEEAFMPTARAMIETGGKRGFDLAGVAGSFNVDDPDAAAFLKQQDQRFAKEVNETTWNRLKATMLEGMAAGEPNVAVGERIDAVFKGRRANKYTIARTEVQCALNGGVDKGFKQSKVVKTKIWVPAGDGNERDEHKGIDQEVPVNSPFVIGGENLQFPGDPGGSPWNIINCRCTEVPGEIMVT
jgi:HK97 family phage portal protein